MDRRTRGRGLGRRWNEEEHGKRIIGDTVDDSFAASFSACEMRRVEKLLFLDNRSVWHCFDA